jgi:hypothetical protein
MFGRISGEPFVEDCELVSGEIGGGIVYINRGVHLTPDDQGMIIVSAKRLSHTISVHAWVLQKDPGLMSLVSVYDTVSM